MRKYDVLRIVFETKDGTSPKEISEKLRTALPNVYIYLGQLEGEGLVKKSNTGKYAADITNEKLSLLLTLRAMVPAKFHILITPLFKGVLQRLCSKIIVEKKEFGVAEIRKLEETGVPCRIALKISRRPASYCLKINETLVQTLLEYHNLEPTFNMNDFREAIDKASISKNRGATKMAESEPEIIKMCDIYYSEGRDISLFSKATKYAPDERIGELLKSAEMKEKEYQIYLNGIEPIIKASIIDNWEKKYIYNTNSIEGNTMSEKEVDEYIKTGKSRPTLSKREIYETNNMRHALQYLKLKMDEEISEGLIRELHFMVQKDIDDSAGNYKNFYNYVKPHSPTTPPQHVKERMRMLVEWYKENKDNLPPFVLAAAFHMQFEMIHPFADGNGRVGRLLMNHILQKKGKLPVTILQKTKQNYYQALGNYSIPQFLLYTLTSFIEEYTR